MIQAVIFDWAGTTIDYGCFAPIKGFIQGFEAIGQNITNAMARKPMGLLKIDHTRAIAAMLPNPVSEADIQKAYQVFESTLFENIVSHCDVKPSVLEAVATLRSRGIQIGSTTGYTAKMMENVLRLSAENGYAPDFCVASDQVPKGRPAPYMIWENLSHFHIENPRHAVKVGDTVADIEEGKTANCWTVAIIMGSSEMGLTKAEEANTSAEDIAALKEQVRATFYKAGADYIIDTMAELPAVIDDINRKLALSASRKLLTPGPLTTRNAVKQAMLTDHWRDEPHYRTGRR